LTEWGFYVSSRSDFRVVIFVTIPT